ncbi:MAG: hypothetical protein U0Q22_13120 [Acidimicrobiales bacterium]
MTNTSSTTAADIASEIDRHVDAIAAHLAGLSPSAVPLGEVADVFARFVRIERLGAAGRVLMLQRVAETTLAEEAGTSTAEWAARQSGGPVGRSRAELETSERLADCTDTADALRRGEVSTEQAGVIADAATVNPGAERGLLDRARRESFKHLRDEAAREKARGMPDPEERQRRIHRQRSCRTYLDADGAMNLVARGTAASMSGLCAELERLTRRRFEQAWARGEREPHDAHRYDALCELAARSVDAAAGDSPPDNPPNGSPTRRRGRSVTHLALIRVDFSALVAGAVTGDEVCEIAGVGPVSVEQCRALLGDAALKLVLTKGVDVAGIVHFGRGANALQKLALLWSQPWCQAEGCDRTILHVDHRTPWARVRETATPNLDHLCGPHNQRKTTLGWELVAGTGRRPFVPPDDVRHPRHRPAPLLEDTG